MVEKMPNARTSDARAGWVIFRSSGFRTELENINRELEAAGHRPVSGRMYSHYNNLVNAGFSRYLSINRFDVARASRPYESASGRYSFVDSSAGVTVSFPRGRRLVSASGTVVRFGDSGAIVAFDDARTVSALSSNKPRTGESISIEFMETGHHINGRIVDFEAVGEQIQIEVEFGHLQSISEYVGTRELPAISVTVRLSETDAISDSVDVVGRQLFYVFELMESARVIANEANRISGSNDYSGVVRVQKLKRESPLDIVFLASASVYLIAKAAAELLGVAERYFSARAKKYEGDGLASLAKIASSKAYVESMKTEIEKKILDELLVTDVQGLPDLDSMKLKKLISSDLLSLAESLAEQGIDGADITSADDQDVA